MAARQQNYLRGISIHALLAESDRSWTRWLTNRHLFLSTLSLRRATITLTLTAFTVPHFYPRSPCGERRLRFSVFNLLDLSFLSTLSLRRATTQSPPSVTPAANFYPRSPCGERHCIIDIINNVVDHFYPRSPCGERPSSTVIVILRKNFYPRSPCGERPTDMSKRLI